MLGVKVQLNNESNVFDHVNKSTPETTCSFHPLSFISQICHYNPDIFKDKGSLLTQVSSQLLNYNFLIEKWHKTLVMNGPFSTLLPCEVRAVVSELSLFFANSKSTNH